MDRVSILDVNIDCLSLQEVLERIKIFLASNEPHYIVTVNPEFLVAAARDMHFRDILNRADIAVADGIGVVRAAAGAGKRLVRVTGVDLTIELCRLAAERGWTLFLLGGWDDTAKHVEAALIKKFPTLKIVGAESGGVIDDPKAMDETLLRQINESGAQIILVAFGHVKQEKWIYHHLDQLPKIRLAIGVGGTFDYVSGKIRRAPRMMQRIGLEWLFRLTNEPTRWRRIVDAVIVFPFLVIKKRFLP